MRNCLKLCCICTIIIICSGCWQVMDSVFKNPTNYGVKYAHVQNEKVFQQEMNDIIARITSSDFTAVNDLIELRDTTHFQIVNREITIDCRNFSHKTDIDTILSTKRNPCNNQQIGSNVDLVKHPYKEFYGRKFENIENKEQFLLLYTQSFDTITNKVEMKKELEKLYGEINYESNALYDLQELKYYAFNKHIIHSYDEFYTLANHYKVKCQGFLLFEKKLGNILKYHKNIKKCKQEK